MLSSRENRIQRENKIRIDFIFLNMNRNVECPTKKIQETKISQPSRSSQLKLHCLDLYWKILLGKQRIQQ